MRGWIERLFRLLRRGPTGHAAAPPDGPHLRHGRTVQGLLRTVEAALLPALLIGMYNTGLQALDALRATRLVQVPGWRGIVQEGLGAAPGFAPSSAWDCLATGALYVLPALAVAVAAGVLCQLPFSAKRGWRTDGLLPAAMIFVLLMPPAAPLWQIAVAMAFGMIFGNELFGGWGRHMVHPGLLAAAFAMLSFPDPSAGHAAWDALGGFEGTPRFAELSVEGMGALARLEQTWLGAFVGLQPGPMGAASPLAAAIGGALLLSRGIVSWRVLAGGAAGMALAALAANAAAQPGGDPVLALPWFWHAALGAGAFGLVFVAAEPATAPLTNPGRWAAGLLAGATVVLIRVANPAHPDGVVLALLLAGVATPLIDHAVVWLNVRRRQARHGR